MSRAPTSRYASVRPSRLRLIEYSTVAPGGVNRTAAPSPSETRTTGISNMCAPAAKVPSFIVT